MKTNSTKTVLIISLCAFFSILSSSLSMAIEPSDPAKSPTGIGSMPGQLLQDGTVCIVDAKDPSICKKALFKVPGEVMKESNLTFYGIFDLDNDGSPEVFLDYWPLPEGDVCLLVYKKIGDDYSLYLKLGAESLGYSPGAWFLEELPVRKAIFMTRYGGSDGEGLFYLDLKKGSLELITDGIYLEGDPIFEDMDKDGLAEIFLEGRGRDRVSAKGAALLHWEEDTYKIWWPNWAIPYVMYASLGDLDGDGQKEIVAVLETEEYSDDLHREGKLSGLRELGIWRFNEGSFVLIDKVRLPNSKYISYPTLLTLRGSRGGEIVLGYADDEKIKCEYISGKIACSRAERR